MIGMFSAGAIDLANLQTGNETCDTAYVPGSLLCGQCAKGYSAVGLTGQCKACPASAENNKAIAITGGAIGVLLAIVYVRLALSDAGSLDDADGIKAIGLSFIQLIYLLSTFPVAWPPVFITVFRVGGAICVLGQHLVNLKCLVPELSDADVFFSLKIFWGIVPVAILVMCPLVWILITRSCGRCIRRCEVVHPLRNTAVSCVSLLVLVWPTLCTETFSMFACTRLCNDNAVYLRADMSETCWQGRHLNFVLTVGAPMATLYVFGLPLAALLRVSKIHSKGMRSKVRKILRQTKSLPMMKENVFEARLRLDFDRCVYGMFYSNYHDSVWWWESTVAVRKVGIALIGVFGAEWKHMQAHVTAMVVVVVLLITAQVRPYRGKSRECLLHRLEMLSLMVTFLCLWAATVFSLHPRCENPDPGAGAGRTLLWCDVLSVGVGVVVMVLVVAIVVAFVHAKVVAKSANNNRRATVELYRPESGWWEKAARMMSSKADYADHVINPMCIPRP
jgi:hypothetical protein